MDSLLEWMIACLMAHGASAPSGALPAYAEPPIQEPAAGAGQGTEQAQLERRVAELERELAEVKEWMAPAEDYAPGYSLGPLLQFHGFADITFGVLDVDSDAPGGDDTSDRFALGQLDFFPTSQLSERISFLNETVLKSSSSQGSSASIERLIIKYLVSDSLNVQAGRFHTTVGYWNEAYHHGEWLQTSIGRPEVVAFDGILPIHLVGIVLKGKQEWRPAGIDYTLEIGNGRGATSDVTQNVSDANDSKAVNLSLAARPAGVPGLRIGAGIYVDEIPANTSSSAGPLHGSLDERILSAFATYREGAWEVLGELFDVEHEDGSSATSKGWYVQVGRKLGDWTPYARVEKVEVDDGDPFYADLDDLERALIGVRWDFSTWNALKLQVGHGRIDAGPGGSDSDVTEVLVQTAFTF